LLTDNGLQAPPLSVYVHIPWCVRKCPYCDFNSHVRSGDLPEKPYVSALIADLEQDLPLVDGRTVHSIFIGGGTPSLFRPESIAELLAGIRVRLRCPPNMEVTLEANPGTVEHGKFEGFRAAGVNRLSIGVQSFNDAHLKALDRVHGSNEACIAAQAARAAGFASFNLDLMFGLPGQRIEDAVTDVEIATDLEPTHLSLYQLTLEPNTLFYRHPPSLPAEDTIWRMQHKCQTLLARRGYAQYEISAYARAGHRCAHNLNYWRFGDYVGIGAGAHGKITDVKRQAVTRLWKVKHPARYLEAAGTVNCLGGKAAIPTSDLPLEFLMNHLRLREGFAEAVFMERTGLPIDVLEPKLSSAVEQGLLERRVGHIRCTSLGWNFLDNVLERFIADESLA
jgi:putative oxygen-independent coproporphyrinogen III oxidase